MPRTASDYASTIDGLKVETNEKYAASGGSTYCNLFAQDVMKLMEAPLPNGESNRMAAEFAGGNASGWRSVAFLDAQKRADLGFPAIAIRAGTEHGHVVVVRPKGVPITLLKEVQVAQAGKKNYNSTTISYAWVAADLEEVKFYTHD